METKRVDEYHKNSSHIYGKLVVVHYLEDMQKDPNFGKFNAELLYVYLRKATDLVKEKYGDGVKVLQSVPDLVCSIEGEQ